MRKKRKSPFINILMALFCIICLLVVIDIISNKLSTEYAQLSEIDKTILLELDGYLKENEQVTIWEDYHLEQKTILAVNGLWGKSYLINPKNEISNLFAVKIDMPQGSALNVYRISRFAPATWSIKADAGNFNEIGKKYDVLGNEVYFTKYDKDESVVQQNSSKHYIAFLSHESFHYYMQNNWAGGDRFGEDLSANDLKLLKDEYNILAEIQSALAGKTLDPNSLIALGKEYVSIMEQRIEANPTYLHKELAMETAEGTANYVGIKASQAADYDLGVMYFDNIKNVPFSEVMPAIAEGLRSQSFLANRMPYETGAQICFLLDALEVEGWQGKLNSQTLDNPVNLYDILREYIQKI